MIEMMREAKVITPHPFYSQPTHLSFPLKTIQSFNLIPPDEDRPHLSACPGTNIVITQQRVSSLGHSQWEMMLFAMLL